MPNPGMVKKLLCCRSGMFIPDPDFFYPGYRILIVSIADPGSRIRDLGSKISKKGEKIGYPIFFCSRKFHIYVGNRKYSNFESVQKKLSQLTKNLGICI
jgi:hypothetical protein